MNTYKIKINGMHCPGCKALLTMSLEEVELRNPNISLETSEATFETEKDQDEVENVLNTIFSELKDYQYLNLTKEN